MGRKSSIEDDIIFVCTDKKCGIVLLIVGICLAVGGIIGLIVAPIAAKQQVAKSIPLTDNSFAATQWVNPPYNVTMQFWLFNTTNANEVLRGTQKPSVAEKGPYSYRQVNQKNVVIYGENDNVSYVATNTFFFDPWRSCPDCKETDVFTMPNAIYTTIAQFLRFKDEDTKRMANMVLLILGERPFITKTVSELLLGGFEDQIISLINAMKYWVPKLNDFNIPKVFQYFPENNTQDGRYEVCVGGKDVKQMGQILTWNGSKNLTWWSTEEANKIGGTDAQIFPPYINRADRLDIFVSDMCRSSYLTYLADVQVDGLQTYRFVLPGEVFNTSTAGNEGFCEPTDKYYPSQSNTSVSCLPAGFLNVSACRGGVGMLLSKPHFLDAADEVIQSIDGIHPTFDHQLIWDIQPTFGSAVNVQTKFQLNVPIYPDPIFWSLKSVKPTVIPLFWFNASALVDPGTKKYLYTNIVIYQTIGYAATFAVLLIGLLILVTLIACQCRNRVKSENKWSSTAERNAHVNTALIEEIDPHTSGHYSSRKV